VSPAPTARMTARVSVVPLNECLIHNYTCIDRETTSDVDVTRRHSTQFTLLRVSDSDTHADTVYYVGI
jgi:hypothetical protein